VRPVNAHLLNHKNQNKMKKEHDAISKMFQYLIENIDNAPATAQLVIQMSKELNAEQIEKAIKAANEKK
jgi:hypothetical protein